MAELLEKDTPQTAAVAERAAPAAEEAQAEERRQKTMRRKRRRRTLRIAVAAAAVAALAFGAYKLFGKKGADAEIVTDVVQYGAITARVEGNGLTKAKKSETITITTAGTVLEVYVAETDHVEEGQPLFTIDSPAAETAVQKARSSVQGYEKQLSAAQKDLAGLNLAPIYSGKLLDTVKLNPGDPISKGTKVATLADDTKMRLTQYYSYAYAGSLRAGQSVEVSIPALMSTVQGRIEAVHMVNRITPEGSKLFSAEIVIPNGGVLDVDMEASATATVDGETVYPYELGKLAYNRVGDLTATVGGTVLSSSLVDYLPVKAGQVLVRIDGEQSENEIFNIEQNLEEARKTLETAEKNLANCSATAPISGTVIGLTIAPGTEIAANTAVVTVSDTSEILVNATVDERNISYLRAGMPVDLDQWGNPGFGTVETVSLSSTINNGVASYPFTILVDNTEGQFQVNSYINYTLTASQNDNCLVLPVQCVRTVGLEDGSSATVVYVQADTKPEEALELPSPDEEIPDGFYPVQVEIGIQDTSSVEIRSGVEEGTTVFTQKMTNQVWG